MADYRDWCQSCGNETNFGSHADGCAHVARMRDVEKERRAAEKEISEWVHGLTDEEYVNQLNSLYLRERALEQELKAAERKYDALRYHRLDFKLMEKHREFVKEKHGI